MAATILGEDTTLLTVPENGRGGEAEYLRSQQ
jgi:hypothetical protein